MIPHGAEARNEETSRGPREASCEEKASRCRPARWRLGEGLRGEHSGAQLLAGDIHTGAVLGQRCRGDRRDEVPGGRGRWHDVDREGPWDDVGGATAVAVRPGFKGIASPPLRRTMQSPGLERRADSCAAAQEVSIRGSSMEPECRSQRARGRTGRDGGAAEGSGRAGQGSRRWPGSSWGSRGGGAGGSKRREGGLKQEEKEEEEGKRAHDSRQIPGGHIRHNRPRPQGGGPPEAPEEGQAFEPQGRESQEFIKLQFKRLFLGQLNDGGRTDRGAILTGLSAAEDLEEVSRRPYIDDDSRGAKSYAATTRCRSPRSRDPELAANREPILQATSHGEYGATCGARSVALVCGHRPHFRGACGQCNGRHDPAPQKFGRAEQIYEARSSSSTRVTAPGSRGLGDVLGSPDGGPGCEPRSEGLAEVDHQALGGEAKRKREGRERQMEEQQGRQQDQRVRQEQEGEGGRKEKAVTGYSSGGPRDGGIALSVEAPGNYERGECTRLAHFALSSGERGHEFDSPGKVATLNDGEPLDLTAFNSPEGGAKLMTEEAEPGEAHVSEDSTIRGIFKRAVEVLRQDGHLQSRRSNTEFDLGSQCPPFPLRIRTEGWGKRLNFPHLPHFDELVNGTMAALNHLAGFEGTLTPSPEDHTSSAASPETSVRALAEKRLAALVVRNHMWEVPESSLSFSDFFSRRKVDYCGEEVKLAQSVSWAAVSESLPEGVGSLPLSDFCTLGTKGYVDDFERYLMPSDAQVRVKPPRVMIGEGEWPDVCSGLIAKRVCEVWPISQLHHIDGAPLLNGMFAVGKGEFKAGIETQRLIMNLVPVNQLCKPLQGDVGTLPAVSGLSGFLLGSGEVVLLSSEDIKCFFYLFSIPTSWKKYMGFNKIVPPELVPPELNGQTCVLVARVLPMGFLNSVSIAQHIHRNVVRWAAMAGSPPVGAEGELRKDRVMSSAAELYRVYLDNFDALERVDANLAGQIKGTVKPQVETLRDMYAEQGLPRHPKKAAERVTVGELQGALLDGEAGFAMPKPQKVIQYCKLGFELLVRGQSTLRELQVVCGGFVYLAMFRRQLLGCLNEVFEHMKRFEGEAPVVRLGLPYQVKMEIARFILLTPLAQMDFRSPVDGEVSCSDASTLGGGLCASKGLTSYGMSAVGCPARGDLPEEHDLVQVLSVGLFDGIAALRVACDVLGLPMAGHVSIEKEGKCRRVVESFFPDTEFFEDVRDFSEEQAKALALKYSNVGLIIVGAGPPCQGVSGLNADRLGALRDERSCLFQEVPRITALLRKEFYWAQVHELIENVASMSSTDRAIMSRAFGRTPHRVDAKGMSLCARPRLYWTTWECYESPGVSWHEGDEEGWEAYDTAVLEAQVDSLRCCSRAGVCRKAVTCRPLPPRGRGMLLVEGLRELSSALSMSFNGGMRTTTGSPRTNTVTATACGIKKAPGGGPRLKNGKPAWVSPSITLDIAW